MRRLEKYSRRRLENYSREASVLNFVKRKCTHCRYEAWTVSWCIGVSATRPPGRDTIGRANDSGRMYSTNFHLDADRRLETRRTTAQDGFQPVQPLENTNHQNTQRRTGPGLLGTSSVNTQVRSEYARSFAGICGARTPALGPEWNTRDTITGERVC